MIPKGKKRGRPRKSETACKAEATGTRASKRKHNDYERLYEADARMSKRKRSTPPRGPPPGEDTDSSSSSSSGPEPSPTPPSKGAYNAADHTDDSSDGLSSLEEEEAIGNKGKRPAVGAKPSKSEIKVMYELCKENNKLLKVSCAGYRRECGS